MKAYKVVRALAGRYLSLYETKHEVEYKLGQWTSPKIGKLFAFRDYALVRASVITRAYVNRPTFETKIFEANVVVSRINYINLFYIDWVANCTKIELAQLWKYKMRNGDLSFTELAKIGYMNPNVIFCNRIRLVRELETV